VQTEIVKELNIKEIETKEIYIQTDKREQNKKDINIQTES